MNSDELKTSILNAEKQIFAIIKVLENNFGMVNCKIVQDQLTYDNGDSETINIKLHCTLKV